MGTLGGFASPFGPPPDTSSSLASLGLAKPFGPPPAPASPLASLGLARWCATRGAGEAGGLPTRLAPIAAQEC
jgi:hypothetical protein